MISNKKIIVLLRFAMTIASFALTMNLLSSPKAKTLLLENFYHQIRKKTKILMEELPKNQKQNHRRRQN